MKTPWRGGVFLAGIIFLNAGWVQAQLIDVDFNNDSFGAASGGPALGPTMSGAAVLGAAGDQWNGISVNSGSGISLIYANGSASSVTMAFTSGGGYDAKSFSGSTPFAGTPFNGLMEDYLFNAGAPQTITLSGLVANSLYNLVLYNAADAAASGRTTFFTVNGVVLSSTWNGAASTLIAGVDYVNFPSALSDGTGNLAITYTGNGSAEGDVDGFQIQVVPKPSPTVTITNPVNGGVFVAPGKVTISATAAVSSGTVTNVQFFTNGVLLKSFLTAPFSLTASNLSAGTYALSAVATAAGVSATSSVVNITVITPASAQINNPAAYTWTTLAGYPGIGSADGVGSAAHFNGPRGTAVDSAGNLYVADEENDTIRKITPGRLVTTIAGLAGTPGTNDGTGGDARFNFPTAVAADGAGNVYVADNNNYTIRKLAPSGTNWLVTTIAGLAGTYGAADGTNSAARFTQPFGVAVDAAGRVYVADTYNETIRMMTPSGTNWVVTTIAGSPGKAGSADGTGTNAQFNSPDGIAVDGATNLYVTDLGNATIRQIIPAGTNWTVSTISGTAGSGGTNEGAGGAAQYASPSAIAVDSATNLYVSDVNNFIIRKITPVVTSGRIVWNSFTFAGSVGIRGNTDATGVTASFSSPNGVAVDGAGNIYLADSGNSEIRKITSAGVVSTIAGSSGSTGSVDGLGSMARFSGPDGVAVDSAGNIYVADTYNDTIRQISSLGEVSTLAGLAGNAGTVDGVGSYARFNQPWGIAVDAAGNLYVSDYGDNTIRRITPAGVVSTIAGLAGSPGTANGTNAVARFFTPQGMAVDLQGNIYVADENNDIIRKITPAGNNWVVSTIAGLARTSGSADGTNSAARFFQPSGVAVDLQGNVYVADQNNKIRKITPAGTNWVVNSIAGGTYGAADGIGVNAQFRGPVGLAVDSGGSIYVADDGSATIRKVTLVGTNWVVSTIGGQASAFGSADGAGSAARFFSPRDVAVDSAGNLYVVDGQDNTIRKGVFLAYAPANPLPYTPPVMSGALAITLLPPAAGGQWRLPWEQIFHNSGEVVSNLAQDNYPIEFRSLPGYVTIQTNFMVSVTNGGTSYFTNQYYATVNPGGIGGTGTLTVNIGPNSPDGSGWRFLGETLWRAPGDTVTNLLPDIYFIEFEPVHGRVKPDSQGAQVVAGLPSVISANYLLAASAPPDVLLPFPVPASQISDVTNYPFGFNGQLQSDVGFGSGVAVRANVVLTAAHLVFNDQTLNYVSQVFWYFQREADVFEPEPQAARGWYVLSGYASQRTNDLQSGLSGADQSTPQSRNLDVAALYFLSPMAGGGDGGYLPSDESPNPWLTGNSLKMLVGYPVDGSIFGDSSIVPGAMYQTDPQPYTLGLATDPLAGQQVYVAPRFLGYPGNSGGPVYAQFDGYYYPAGVYLGTLFTGSQPSASLVRAIDSTVVNLITNAAFLGDNGTNNTINNSGGGVVTIIPSLGISRSNPGYLILQLGPPSAVQAGAAWKLSTQSDAFYSTASPSLQVVTNTNALLVQFKPVPGWNLPTNRSVTVVPAVILTNVASYTVSNPVLTFDLARGLGISGTTNTTYQIQSNASLTGAWVAFKTNTLTNAAFNLITNNPRPGFYRALWLTNSP